MERNRDGLLEYGFEITFRVSVEVENINDDFINKDAVEKAAKSAAHTELARQVAEAIKSGAFD